MQAKPKGADIRQDFVDWILSSPTIINYKLSVIFKF